MSSILNRPYFSRRSIPFVASLSLLMLSTVSIQAQAPARKGGAVKHAEAILGKPLNETQKKAIREANGRRQKAIKAIQKKYRVEAAKTLGISVESYEQREKNLRVKKVKGR